MLAAHPPRGTGPEEAVQFLFRNVDESDAPLTDWIEALAELHAWVVAHGRRTTLRMAVGYLACCDAAVKTQASLVDLPSTVRLMLGEYGFDG